MVKRHCITPGRSLTSWSRAWPPATTTRTLLLEPGTANTLTIFTGVSSALVSRLRSSWRAMCAPSRFSTALLPSGRSTVHFGLPLSLSCTTPPFADSMKFTSVTSTRASGAAATTVEFSTATGAPSISTSATSPAGAAAAWASSFETPLMPIDRPSERRRTSKVGR